MILAGKAFALDGTYKMPMGNNRSPVPSPKDTTDDPRTVTTTALLERLLEPHDDEVWREFDSRFRPILTGFARRLGLNPDDAEDVAQETAMRVVRYYSKGYDRTRGKLRTWILAIARRVIVDNRAAQQKRGETRGLSAIADLPDSEGLDEILRAEFMTAVFDRAMDELKRGRRFDARTVRAFELFVLAGRSASDVAAELDMSRDSVYASKHRCARELRAIVARYENLYEI